jgi:hypothetical protein
MTRHAFKVRASGDQWVIHSDQQELGPYATREAAFEAAVGPASIAVKEGDEVVIEVAPHIAGRALSGSAD